MLCAQLWAKAGKEESFMSVYSYNLPTFGVVFPGVMSEFRWHEIRDCNRHMHYRYGIETVYICGVTTRLSY